MQALSPHLFLTAIPEVSFLLINIPFLSAKHVLQLQHLPHSFHQFILSSVRRVFLDTSPDPQVEDLKRRLKVAEDRLKEQSTSHTLAISRLNRRLELQASRKNARATLLKMLYKNGKYPSHRGDFYTKSCVFC